MIDKQTNSAKYSDEAIRSFLFGQLAANDQICFEQRLFTDDDFESRVRLAELALTDDYTRDRLSRQKRDHFHKTYLVTTERKQMLDVSQALHDRFRSRNIATRTSLTQRLKTAFDVSQPAWRYAFAALILLLVFATVWRGIKEPQIVQQIIPKPVAPKPTATRAPQPANHPNTASSPNHVEEYPALPSHTAVAISVSLEAQSTADKPTVVTLPSSDAGTVRFEISFVTTERGSFLAELLTMKGELVFSADSLAPTNDSKIDFDVPTGALRAGDYQIKLSRKMSGSPESTTYYVRVQ